MTETEVEERAARAMSAALAEQQAAIARQELRMANARKSTRTFPLVLVGLVVGVLVGHFGFGDAGRGAQVGLAVGFAAALVARLAS